MAVEDKYIQEDFDNFENDTSTTIERPDLLYRKIFFADSESEFNDRSKRVSPVVIPARSDASWPEKLTKILLVN